MGQKINPLGLRIGIIQKAQSEWVKKPRIYSQFVMEDYLIRQTIFQNYSKTGVSKVLILRKTRLNQIHVKIKTVRISSLLGRKGEGLEELKNKLQTKLDKHRKNTKLVKPSSLNNIKSGSPSEKPPGLFLFLDQIENPSLESSYIADFLVEELEKRKPFRRVIRQSIRRSQRDKIKGIKIQLAGRLNGAEMARTEWVRKGRVPLQTFRANIDYVQKTASTIYGLLGIKVWVFKGEII